MRVEEFECVWKKITTWHDAQTSNSSDGGNISLWHLPQSSPFKAANIKYGSETILLLTCRGFN